MNGDGKKDSSIEKQVARISGNFESDILRLIKTQSMIKSSSGIIGEEIKYLDSKIQQIQEKLDELNLKTSELNDFLQVSLQDKGLSSNHVGLYLNDFISSLTKENSEINSIKKELTDRLKSGSDSLKTLQKFYIAELEAFKHELDSGLTNLGEEINGKLNEEINTSIIENTYDEAEEAKEDTIDETENILEDYAIMPGDSISSNDEQASDDKFLYISILFLVLFIIGFFVYNQLSTHGNLTVTKQPLMKNNQNEVKTELNKVSEKPDPVSQPTNIKTINPKQYLLSERGTLNRDLFNGDFNHKIIVKRANIRNGPGKSYGIVSVLNYGTSIALLNESQGIWTKIKLPDGREGWVAKKLITK